MIIEMKYILKIQMQEIFRSIKKYIFIYALIIILSNVLYKQDFSMKITSNLVLLTWISLMSLMGIKVFTESERGSLFVINKIPNFFKYAKLISAQMIFNLPLFMCMYVQIFFLGQESFKSLGLTLLAYLFAIMLGVFLGNTFSKTSSLIILLLIFAYNFLGVNPYKQTEYTYFLGMNEYLFNLSNINVINLGKMMLIILLGVFTIYLKRKHLYLKIGKYISCLTLFLGLFILEMTQYSLYVSGENTSLQVRNIENREVVFKNINSLEYMEGVKLLEKTQDYYIDLGGSSVKSYVIKKDFLSSLQWKLIDQPPNYILEENDLIVNIYSLAELNFHESDIISKNCDDMIDMWKSSIPNYIDGNRYFRHIIDGSGNVFKIKAIEATFGENSSVSNSINKELDTIIESPITKNNYVKRVGILVANNHKQDLVKLVRMLDDINVETDREFIQILKNKFPDIYQDPYMYSFFKDILRG
ncbi:hypothetical protein [Streptococcus jiangjianxini]|uniref:hypothetical protein n=1 Tax=Streptococcus jiangjianxini TaxID=3161189 RepID=UPI0032EA9914